MNGRIIPLLTRLLSDTRKVLLRFKIKAPVMFVRGDGTLMSSFLHDAARLLGAGSILPEHADVANAVGAVTSRVVVRRSAEIRAYQGVSRVEGLPGARQFADFE